MNTLEKIVKHKAIEVNDRKSLYPTQLLERSIYFSSPAVSLKKYLLREDKNGIIAEIKRKSPSKGMINKYISIEKTSIGYMQAGASALSVLTDSYFFGGSSEDLTIARKFNYCPILRKDFIIDEYQIIESRSIGADAILLIAAILTEQQILRFTDLAHQLGLEVLLELHDREELGKIPEKVDVVGINNRNLKTMRIDMSQSTDLINLIPSHIVKISESGIDNVETLLRLKEEGFNGFLIGSYFMEHPKPEEACKEFISLLNKHNKLQEA